MPTSAEPPASMLSDDTLGLLLLALGAGAGILGAMGKRIRDEGRGSPANRTGPTP